MLWLLPHFIGCALVAQQTTAVTKLGIYAETWPTRYPHMAVAEALLPHVCLGTMYIARDADRTRIFYEARPEAYGPAEATVLFDGEFAVSAVEKPTEEIGYLVPPLDATWFEGLITRDSTNGASEVAYRWKSPGQVEGYLHIKRLSEDEPLRGFVVLTKRGGLDGLRLARFDLATRDEVHLSPIEAELNDANLKGGGASSVLWLGGDFGTSKDPHEPLVPVQSAGTRTEVRDLNPAGRGALQLKLVGLLFGKSVQKNLMVQPPANRYVKDAYRAVALPERLGDNSTMNASLLRDYSASSADVSEAIESVYLFCGPSFPPGRRYLSPGWDAAVEYFLCRPEVTTPAEDTAIQKRKIDIPLTDLRTMIGWIICRRIVITTR